MKRNLKEIIEEEQEVNKKPKISDGKQETTRDGIKTISNYKDGKLNGVLTKINIEINQMIEEKNYVDGKLNGECKNFTYYDEIEITDYINDEKHGKYLHFKTEDKTLGVNGYTKDILLKQFGEKECMIKRLEYKNGKLDGESIINNNRRITVENYKDGKLHGDSFEYDVDCHGDEYISCASEYYNGIAFSEREFNECGNVIYQKSYNKEGGLLWKYKYDDDEELIYERRYDKEGDLICENIYNKEETKLLI